MAMDLATRLLRKYGLPRRWTAVGAASRVVPQKYVIPTLLNSRSMALSAAGQGPGPSSPSSTASETVTRIARDDILQANHQYKDKIIIQETPAKGWGVFSLQDYQPGDIVLRANAVQTLSHANAHTIQLDWNHHVIMDLPAILLNHRCNSANLVALLNENGAYDFCAHRPIFVNDELQFDYETTEYALQNGGFGCHCGDAQCRNHLRGFRYHGSQVVSAYGRENVAPYLLTVNDDNEDDSNDRSDKTAAHG